MSIFNQEFSLTLYRLVKVELKPLVKELSPIFKSLAAPKKIELALEIDPSLDYIKVDPTYFRLVLINLVGLSIGMCQDEGTVQLLCQKS